MRLFNLFQLSLFNYLANRGPHLRLLDDYNSQNCEFLYTIFQGQICKKCQDKIGKKSLFIQLRTPRMREDCNLFGVRVEKLERKLLLFSLTLSAKQKFSELQTPKRRLHQQLGTEEGNPAFEREKAPRSNRTPRPNLRERRKRQPYLWV